MRLSQLCRALLLIPLLASGAMAQDATVEDVPLPKARPVSTSTPPSPADPKPAENTTPGVPLPRERPDPDALKTPPAETPTEPKTDANDDAPADDFAPDPEPAAPTAPQRIYQSACPALLSGQVEGKLLPPLTDKQCGAQSPLSITGVLVNGKLVPVSGGVTTSCGVATALPAWIGAIDGYLFAKENTHVAEVLVGTSYICRNVNNGTSGNLSFHAFADALDIIGFKLEDGRTVTVEAGWSDALSSEGRLLRFAHDAACAQFATTLGPEANVEHSDHLHLDMGCHGKSCTARLCE
ncbi:MAG: extensin family protein [Devosia sp.]|jgi:hypothetical protein|uniref:extensin family protein n=1 Tax=Devosia sp. TaxID=1871048 RepID=UPI0037C1A386